MTITSQIPLARSSSTDLGGTFSATPTLILNTTKAIEPVGREGGEGVPGEVQGLQARRQAQALPQEIMLRRGAGERSESPSQVIPLGPTSEQSCQAAASEHHSESPCPSRLVGVGVREVGHDQEAPGQGRFVLAGRGLRHDWPASACPDLRYDAGGWAFQAAVRGFVARGSGLALLARRERELRANTIIRRFNSLHVGGEARGEVLGSPDGSEAEEAGCVFPGAPWESPLDRGEGVRSRGRSWTRAYAPTPRRLVRRSCIEGPDVGAAAVGTLDRSHGWSALDCDPDTVRSGSSRSRSRV